MDQLRDGVRRYNWALHPAASAVGTLVAFYGKVESSGPTATFFGYLAVFFLAAFIVTFALWYHARQENRQLSRENDGHRREIDRKNRQLKHWQDKYYDANGRLRRRRS
jgi:uncharacterized membrane protein YhaH (DUF805 family)